MYQVQSDIAGIMKVLTSPAEPSNRALEARLLLETQLHENMTAENQQLEEERAQLHKRRLELQEKIELQQQEAERARLADEARMQLEKQVFELQQQRKLEEEALANEARKGSSSGAQV